MGTSVISGRHLVIAASACLAIGCAGLQRERSSQRMWDHFNRTLAGLAGSDAVDCGHSGSVGESADVRECVVEQLAEGKAFRASTVASGIDSQLIIGIARNERGEAFAVTGDSDVHGGSGFFAKPLITTWRCERLAEPKAGKSLPDCVGREEVRSSEP
jgi:hypothetical protein